MPESVLSEPQPSNSSVEPRSPFSDSERFAASQRVLCEVEAHAAGDLEPINLDLDVLAETVFAAEQRIQPLLPTLARMPGFDPATVARLRDYALAVLYWNGSASRRASTKRELGAQVERGIALRKRALLDLRALVGHGVLPNEFERRFGRSVAYLKVANDLLAIGNLVHQRWADVNGKSALTLAGADELVNQGTAILHAIADRENAEAKTARDLARRDRAFTRLVRTYAAIRVAILYLRHAEGDADVIAPPLYAARQKKTAKAARGA